MLRMKPILAIILVSYAISAWADDSELLCDFDTLGIYSGNTTLKANWIANTYTVQYKCNSNDPIIRTDSVTYNTDYTFAGKICDSTNQSAWVCNGVGSGAGYSITNGVGHTDTPWNTTGDLICVSYPQVVTVTYDANGGSGTMDTTTCTQDNVCTLATNAFAKPGYTFNGWATNPDDITSTYQNTINITSNTTLYAIWTQATHTCVAGKYLQKQTNTCSTCPAGYYCSGGELAYSDTEDTGLVKCADGLFAPEGSKTANDCGHKFVVNGEALYLHKDKITTPSLRIQVGDVTYYANMTKKRTVISANATQKLKVKYNGMDYYVYDNTINPSSNSSYAY